MIALSFARIKETNLANTIEKLREIIRDLFKKNRFLLETDKLEISDKLFFEKILSDTASEANMTSALYQLSAYLNEYYGKKVIILLDEYDTPCRKHMWEDTGMSLWHLREVFLIPHLRLIHILKEV